ncbi:MAG TPA: LLM class flavin-dependent oxidoreductase [Ktedonobacterales bacterium]|nr:LLM class flavin-dependent oxidoreductase [Ktedonobacterales bacterium]
MFYGISIPNFGDTSDPRTLAEMAREAEDAGWDGFFVWDHVMFMPSPTSDPWIALAAIALATQRIKLGPMVTPLPRRRPVKLARETATLDRISNGRLILGVGIGVREWEWDDMGEATDLKVRGDMLDEGLDLLVKLWSGEPVRHHGQYYTVDVTLPDGSTAAFYPHPVQQPRIPIWVAGMWPNKKPFRRAAQWEGVYPIRAGDFDEASALKPDDVRAITAYTSAHRASGDPFDIVIAGETPGGDLARGADITASYAEAGCTWWIEDISPWPFGWKWEGPWPVEAMRERVRQGPPRH